MMKFYKVRVGYHHNGVAGNGFHVVLFDCRFDGKLHHMVATVFSDPGDCAVLDTDETQQGNIEFAKGNSWRGDDFEPTLRRFITEYDK